MGDQLLKDLKASIIALIEDPNNETLHVDMYSLDTFEEIFEVLGFKRGELDTNGWAVDFWLPFDHPSLGTYCVMGSLWNGNYKIYKGDEEDTIEERT